MAPHLTDGVLPRSSSRNEGSSLSGYGPAIDVGGSPQISTATARHAGVQHILWVVNALRCIATMYPQSSCLRVINPECGCPIAGWPAEYAPAGSFVSSDSHQQSSVGDQHEVAMQAETPHSQVCHLAITWAWDHCRSLLAVRLTLTIESLQASGNVPAV